MFSFNLVVFIIQLEIVEVFRFLIEVRVDDQLATGLLSNISCESEIWMPCSGSVLNRLWLLLIRVYN